MLNVPEEPWAHIHWPEGLDESRFLSDYWQKAPLLIRQGLPEFTTPLDADELAGLSLEADTNPRLIIQDSDGHYKLEHGPFDDARFLSLTGDNWSLLVTDVEKHIPELRAYLAPFDFLPSWRIDDLMVSYAPVGASVGAHIDEYDVFLLQASGTRRWAIDSRPRQQHALLPNADLKLLADFEPTDTWDLRPGDILYLPPGIAHHGIASGDPCTTWSIGFRAPAIPDLVMRMAESICDAMSHSRYTDPTLTTATAGEISEAALRQFEQIWRTTTQLQPETINEIVGQLLTETANTNQPTIDIASISLDEHLRLAPFSRVAWFRTSTATVRLFIDGVGHDCSEALALSLSDPGQLVALTDPAWLPADKALLTHLLAEGSLTIAD